MSNAMIDFACSECEFGEQVITVTPNGTRVQCRCTKQGCPNYGICHEPEFRCKYGKKDMLDTKSIKYQFRAVVNFLIHTAEMCVYNAKVIEGQMKLLEEYKAKKADMVLASLQNAAEAVDRELETVRRAEEKQLWDLPPMGGFHNY